MLFDTSGARFPSALVEEGIRTALGVYNLRRSLMGQPAHTLSGLDGAAETSLPAEWDSLIALGAAGFAASSRHLQRSEAYDLSDSVPTTLAGWAAAQLDRFHAELERLDAQLDAQRRSGLCQGSAPWAESPWPLDGWEGTP